MGQELTKTEGWRERLSALMVERKSHPFEWGVNDCCMFAADAVVAMTGVDVVAEFRGTYFTEETAEKLGDIEDLARKQLLAAGAIEVVSNFSNPGDVAVIRCGEKKSCAICVGNRVAVPGLHGLAMRSRSKIITAFGLK